MNLPPAMARPRRNFMIKSEGPENLNKGNKGERRQFIWAKLADLAEVAGEANNPASSLRSKIFF